jgi:hypothetical protein
MSPCNNWRLRWALLLLACLASTVNAGEDTLYDSFEKGPLDPQRWKGIGQSSGQPMDMLRAPDHRGDLLLGARGIQGGHSRQALEMLEQPQRITGAWIYLAVENWWAHGCEGTDDRTQTRVGFTMELSAEYTARLAITGVSDQDHLSLLGQVWRRDGRTVEVDLGAVPKGWPLHIGISWHPGGLYFQREDCTHGLGFNGGASCIRRRTSYWVPVPVTRVAKAGRVLEAVSETATCEASDAFSLTRVHEVYVERAADK